jgi:hypothetical protein
MKVSFVPTRIPSFSKTALTADAHHYRRCYRHHYHYHRGVCREDH